MSAETDFTSVAGAPSGAGARATVLMHHPYTDVRQRTQSLFAGRESYRVLTKRIDSGDAPRNVETFALPPLRALQYPLATPALAAWGRRRLHALAGDGATYVITHEAQFYLIPRGSRVVLDFHDDNAEFYQGRTRDFFRRCQQQALRQVAEIVCSSKPLRDKAVALSGRAVSLVENGFEPSFIRPYDPRPGRVAVYFGTIDWWFDVDLLNRLLLDGFEVRLIGPVSPHVDLPRHEKLVRLGVQPHARLPELTHDASLLILPFKASSLINAVNPVKLYEYVALGRPVLSSYWPELDLFSGLVTFYQPEDILADRISAAMALKVDSAKRANFLMGNSWDARRDAFDQIVLGAGVAR